METAELACTGCGKRPVEISSYMYMVTEDEDGIVLYPDLSLTAAADRYVRENEGTYNRDNGHFLCDNCYIKAGMPTAPWGWKCP